MRRTWVIVALAAVLALATAGFALARAGSPLDLLFGPRMIRAEVVEADGSVYDVYRGRLVAATFVSVTVREADGRVDTVPVTTSTRFRVGGGASTVASLRRGMRVTVVRSSNGPAIYVEGGR